MLPLIRRVGSLTLTALIEPFVRFQNTSSILIERLVRRRQVAGQLAARLTRFDPHAQAVLAHLAGSRRFVQGLLGAPGVLDDDSPDSSTFVRTLIDAPAALDHLVSSPAFLTRLFGPSTARERSLGAPVLLRELVRHRNFSRVACDERIHGLVDLHREIEQLADFIDMDDPRVKQGLGEAIRSVSDPSQVGQAIVEAICPADELLLRGARLLVQDKKALPLLLRELFVDHQYYFATEARAPRVLDCGGHYGLAVYYFKRLYSGARVTTFEPNPVVRAALLENVRRNHWTDVDVLPYAISDHDGTASFFVSKPHSMAGSLTRRRVLAGDEIERIEVPCRRLTQFLDEPVHFLKLDIEGVEDGVLRESQSKLHNVQHLFCEYHDGRGLERSRLAEILTILETAGFDAHVSKSAAWQRPSQAIRPMTSVHKNYSVSIWAKARDWPSQTADGKHSLLSADSTVPCRVE